MKEIRTFNIENSQQIWTLLSVIIGGVVTYISTSASERRKSKRQNQKENLEQILIPYCTCLEQTIIRINQVYQEPAELSNDKFFKKWLSTLGEPLVYLEAAKRVYLTKSMRQKLNHYKYSINTFFNTIENEYKICISKYEYYMSKKLMSFSNIHKSMYISLLMNTNTEAKVKIAIINKNKLSLRNDFSQVDFVKNDDPDNYQCTSVNLNNEIRNTWDAIHLGVMDICDIDDPEMELSYILLDYIDENTSDEQEVMSQIIDETQGAKMFREISNQLNEMLDELIKNIDKITN